MAEINVSRRSFTKTVGVAVGAALTLPKIGVSVAEARLPAGAPSDVVQLNANENPYGPCAAAVAAITRSERVASRYPDAREQEIRAAIAKLHGVGTENVLLGCGSSEILRIVDNAFLDETHNVVVAEPTFEAVVNFAGIEHAKAVKVPQTADYRHDLPAMAAACTAQTPLVYVCNPNNPTGTIVSREEMADFFGRVPRSTWILVDEAYHHFVQSPKYASAFDWMGKQPNLLVMRTFSKVYGMAGMRLGYVVGPKEPLATMRKYLLISNANTAVIEAGLASLADPNRVPEHRKLNADTRQWLYNELEKDHRRYIPSEANFVMVDVHTDVRAIGESFRQRKILVGRKFPSMGNWLRISIGTPAEMQTFMTALREIVPA